MEDAGYQPGQQVTPELRLRNKLGEGAMGSIWAADHLRLGHPVAVKFVSASQAEENPQAFERFQRESSILEGFRHPNVIGAFGQGTTTGGQPYIVLEMMAGEEIVDRIERDGVFTVEELTLIVHQLGSALAALHSHGIIHRDIKAENIFIAGDEHQLQIKLYDFGLAKRPGEKDARKMLTGMGVMVGTAEYMSPEQIVSSRDVDHYADLWAFAVLTYVCMCGGLPFHGTNLVETFAEVKDGKFERPSTIRDDIGPAIDSWFVRAFHMERDKRYGTAQEMIDSWNAAIAGGAVAIPATVPPVAGKPPVAPQVAGQPPASGQVAAFPGAFASAPPQPHAGYPAHPGMQPGMMPPPGPGMVPGQIPQMPPPMMAQQKSGPSAAVLAIVAVVVVAATVAVTLLLL